MSEFQKIMDEANRVLAISKGEITTTQDNQWNGVTAEIARKMHEQGVQKAIADARAIVDSHAARRNTINGNGDLSVAGKKSKIFSLIVESDAAIDAAITPMIDTLNKKIQRSTDEIANAASAKPSVTDMLQFIEIRNVLANNDILENEVLLDRLSQSGEHDLTVAAILGASPAAQLVRPAAAKAASEALIARREPAHAAELVAAEGHLLSLTQTYNRAHNSIASPAERANYGGELEPLAPQLKGIKFNAANAPSA